MEPDRAWRRFGYWTAFLICWTLIAGAFLSDVPVSLPMLVPILALFVVVAGISALFAAGALARSGWRRQPGQARRPRAVELWVVIVILALLSAAWGGYVLSRRVPAAWHHVAWDRGTITVQDCTLVGVSGDDRRFARYRCHGEFVADGGRYRARVAFADESSDLPSDSRIPPPPPSVEIGERLRALAPGPGATRAQTVPKHSVLQLVAASAFSVGNGLLSLLPILVLLGRAAARRGFSS
jgi:hypothetical protein